MLNIRSGAKQTTLAANLRTLSLEELHQFTYATPKLYDRLVQQVNKARNKYLPGLAGVKRDLYPIPLHTSLHGNHAVVGADQVQQDSEPLDGEVSSEEEEEELPVPGPVPSFHNPVDISEQQDAQI